jgi:hypothetical protein
MSDLTDKVSASADVNASECDLKMPYSEIVVIAGVSDIPLLYGHTDDEVPPAPSRGRHSKICAPKPQPKAVVSLVSPHKLLMLSKDFCDLFGFSIESEICGRPVKILHGPRTDPSGFISGIKDSALSSTTIRTLVLYARDGKDIELEVRFSPYLGGDDVLAGCLLEMSPVSNTN